MAADRNVTCAPFHAVLSSCSTRDLLPLAEVARLWPVFRVSRPARESLTTSATCVGIGTDLFSEGLRSVDGELHEFRPDIVQLLTRSDLYIVGPFDASVRGSWLPWRLRLRVESTLVVGSEGFQMFADTDKLAVVFDEECHVQGGPTLRQLRCRKTISSRGGDQSWWMN